MRRGIRWTPFCVALLWLLAPVRPPAASAQPTTTGWFDVLQTADAASVLKLRKLGLNTKDENEVLNQIFAGVFDRVFGERLDPVNLSGLFEIAESIRRGEFKVPPGQASNPYTAIYFPSLAASGDPQATALNAFRRTRELWGRKLYSAPAYKVLKWRVKKMINRETNPYVPSAGIRIAGSLPKDNPLTKLKAEMRVQEEELFDSWIRDRPDLVRRLRDGGYLTSRAGAALGRTRADARRLFDDFLVRITNLPENQAVIAGEYQKFHVPRIRRGLRRKSREEAARFSRLAKAAAQLAVRSIDVEPQALQLRVRACGPNLQRDGVCARYAYAIVPGIRHSVSIRFTRNRGETISETRIGGLTSRTGREVRELRLPGVSRPGRYAISFAVRTVSGKSAEKSRGFNIGGPSETNVQLAKELRALLQEANGRLKRAWQEMKALSEQNRRIGREAMRLVKAIGAEKKSLDEMRAALTGDKQAQRDDNKRVIAFNEKVRRLRELQTERDGLKAEARALGRSLDRYRSLAKGLADALKKGDLDAALRTALGSTLTRDLGYYDRLGNLRDRRSAKRR